MDHDNINVEKAVQYWVNTADRDFLTMQHLFDSGDYHWALFIGHLVIEKLLKARIVKETHRQAPYIHDLRRLKKAANLELDEEKTRWLDVMTTFYLNARYDDYKQEFYRKCTKEFTSLWIENIKILRLWIKERL